MTLPEVSTPNGLEPALAAWRAALGARHVMVDADTRAQLESATYRLARRTLGLLQPSTRHEVQECLRIANRHGIPIYPVSRGRNWGLGSRMPASDGCMVLELSRLDRVVDFSEDYAYLTVEPGVTFAQAWNFLEERRSRLMLNTTLGPPDGSLVGNALERGHGSGFHFDRFQHVCALEVVLPSGDMLHTGLMRAPNAGAARLHRWGSGPYVDGLFSQSNLGVVTEMTFFLHPAPADLTQFEFRIAGAERIDAAMEVVRELSFDARFRCQFNNVHRMTFDERAWGEGHAAARKPADATTFLHGIGAIHCESAAEGMAARRRMLAKLRGEVEGLRYLSPLRRVLARSLRGPLERLGVRIPEGALHPRPGAPTLARVAAMYAVKPRGPRPAEVREVDLDRDRCGVMWYCPVLPYGGRHMREVMTIVERLCEPHRLEPQLTFLPHSPRSLDGFVALVYDRDDHDADTRATECYDAIADALFEAGYPPYRLPAHRMDLATRDAPEYAAFLRRLKQALDPNDILAPGRYDGR